MQTGDKLGEHELSGGPEAWEAAWVSFLERVLQKAGR